MRKHSDAPQRANGETVLGGESIAPMPLSNQKAQPAGYRQVEQLG